ncbi:HotDog domain-containing protein [Podospora appendiculata]|uniref:HotDog domain-containing protein n=1 Tax=Podospora appendiculata TaxID=314037 RepID=A0AAE1CBJ9_9PEZI|nr:HotDog domain-containing protein [Podospora appendiculata]
MSQPNNNNHTKPNGQDTPATYTHWLVDPALERFPAGEQRVRELNRRSLANSKPDPTKTTPPSAQKQDWTASLIPHLTLLPIPPSVLPPNPHPGLTYAYTVQPGHCNGLRNLHGGCIATLFDYCTTMPLGLVSAPGYWLYLGVSRSLNTTYLRPIPVGTDILIHCEILQIGRRLCSLKGTMRRASDGALLATCEHGKFNTDPAPSNI